MIFLMSATISESAVSPITKQACSLRMPNQEKMMYMEMRMAPVGSSHHAAGTCAATPAVTTAVKLLSASLRWSSASASAVPLTLRSLLQTKKSTSLPTMALARMPIVKGEISNVGWPVPFFTPSHRPATDTCTTPSESVHMSTALIITASGSRRVLPAGNLGVGRAMACSAAYNTHMFTRSTAVSTSDDSTAYEWLQYRARPFTPSNATLRNTDSCTATCTCRSKPSVGRSPSSERNDPGILDSTSETESGSPARSGA
mmetsp:Transcript_50115/g.95727  ORF Transcript_50115/g.95727 Transcript_50115/m.95727 type:complete len:258 (+) Transcript_50115:48-821(+)